MSGVSVAEKRAQLESAGEEWPVCDCHGEPKEWKKDDRRKQGGSWRCKEEQRRYVQSEKGREKKRKRNRRYRQSEKGREAQRRHDRRFVARHPRYNTKYSRSHANRKDQEVIDRIIAENPWIEEVINA